MLGIVAFMYLVLYLKSETWIEGKVKQYHETNGECGGETQVDGFAWAFHGLTKD